MTLKSNIDTDSCVTWQRVTGYGVRIGQLKVVVALHDIKWLDFVTETDCVRCEVRTGSLTVVLAEFWCWNVNWS